MNTYVSLFPEYVQQAPEVIREYLETKHLLPANQYADIYSKKELLKIYAFSKKLADNKKNNAENNT